MDGQEYRNAFLRRGIITDECLGYFLATSAGYWPDRELVSFGDERYSYGDIHRWSIVVARSFVEAGVRPSDRVLIQAVNSAQLLALQFAAWRIGAITVPIVPMYRRHELRAVAADIRPRVVVASGRVGSRDYCSEIDEVLAELRQEPILRIVIDSPADRDGWRIIPGMPFIGEPVSEAGLPEPAGPQDCAVILFTSGSTAAPKGAKLASGAIVNSGRAMQKVLGIAETDVALCATPLGHTSAFLVSVVLPMTVGGRVAVLQSWQPDDAIILIEREKVTFMGAPALILHDLVERYERTKSQSHRIGKFYCGGAAMPPSLIERADRVGIKASRNYGMTETTGSIAMCHSNRPLERRAHFDAYPFFGSELEVVDADHQPLPSGSVGEIRIRCPLMMIGYTDPALTAAQIDSDGWFYTGDLGKLDPENWLSIEGRLKDIINRGGEKFSSSDIEAAVASCPDVADVAVVGAPDERFGEIVAAFIRLKPNVAWTGPERIIGYLEAAKLATPKRPVQWHVMADFPRTPSGKIQKQALRDLLWTNQPPA